MRFMSDREFAAYHAKAEQAQNSNDNVECDCAPGCCDGGAEVDPQEVEFEQMMAFLGGIFGGDPVVDEETAQAIEIAERREAVAQLGRIIEGLTILTAIHADLVKATVEG
ncbi:hypothetical protein V1279_002949 [Bradyrhizobium sp. AZCC 1610]|uniref:hypothetical protein n=1 Tax=Bradyrhizobium sp. AZCC 1610 TaxID=3117020 RepID=UPI002FF1630D